MLRDSDKYTNVTSYSKATTSEATRYVYVKEPRQLVAINASHSFDVELLPQVEAPDDVEITDVNGSRYSAHVKRYNELK